WGARSVRMISRGITGSFAASDKATGKDGRWCRFLEVVLQRRPRLAAIPYPSGTNSPTRTLDLHDLRQAAHAAHHVGEVAPIPGGKGEGDGRRRAIALIEGDVLDVGPHVGDHRGKTGQDTALVGGLHAN